MFCGTPCSIDIIDENETGEETVMYSTTSNSNTTDPEKTPTLYEKKPKRKRSKSNNAFDKIGLLEKMVMMEMEKE